MVGRSRRDRVAQPLHRRRQLRLATSGRSGCSPARTHQDQRDVVGVHGVDLRSDVRREVHVRHCGSRWPMDGHEQLARAATVRGRRSARSGEDRHPAGSKHVLGKGEEERMRPRRTVASGHSGRGASLPDRDPRSPTSATPRPAWPRTGEQQPRGPRLRPVQRGIEDVRIDDWNCRRAIPSARTGTAQASARRTRVVSSRVQRRRPAGATRPLDPSVPRAGAIRASSGERRGVRGFGTNRPRGALTLMLIRLAGFSAVLLGAVLPTPLAAAGPVRRRRWMSDRRGTTSRLRW